MADFNIVSAWYGGCYEAAMPFSLICPIIITTCLSGHLHIR